MASAIRPEVAADVNISIDRGGTFCDVIALVQGRDPVIFKLLSEDPSNYKDAPIEAVRRVLELVGGTPIPKGEKLDGSRIASCRVGTTVATNALLTGNGEKFAFATTEGFRDVCVIGDSSRPKLFDLNVRLPEALHSTVIEIDERITIDDYDLNPTPIIMDSASLADPDLVRTESGEVIRILKRPDSSKVREQLQELQSHGYTSLAVSFMHGYLYPSHENLVAEIAREVGFEYVTTSSETSPSIKFLNRSNSTCSEAYLYPVVKRYVDGFEGGFKVLPKRIEFMGSDSGLKTARKFRGNEALVSGPAGGVVGIARSCFDADDGTPLIGFDMGGTSTDVSRFDGKFDYLTETNIAGRTISVPMLNISTVAAGGGSILFARNGLLVAGPESAGAHPGPACYRKGGPLTVTDANLFLGRLVVSAFPNIFGVDANQPLDTEVVAKKFHEITAEFNAQTSQQLTPEEVAYGFLDIANETMSRPIRNTTEARGFAPEKHNLVSFGGAGGQHACPIASKLGISRVLIHKWSSLLSAYGISHADLQKETVVPFAAKLTKDAIVEVEERMASLRSSVGDELYSQGALPESVQFDELLVLKYFGTDTSLTISKPGDGDYAAAFESEHLREFAFSMSRPVVIEAVKVRGTGNTGAREEEVPALKEKAATKEFQPQTPKAMQKVFMAGSWQDAGVYRLEEISPASVIDSPAMIIDNTQTILVETEFRAYILSNHVLLERKAEKTTLRTIPTDSASALPPSPSLNPIQLSVFAHRFMSIADQMGNTLQRTSISPSIKERLDFSCAVFSSEGKLVANAPHIPIHLGSMQFAIQAQHRHWAGKLQDGDVLMTNHPQWGGTHLPDLTVVTPVFIDGEIAFYVASRGHHADIGGKGITSMMPESRALWEEGVCVKTMKIVSGGNFLEDDIKAEFEKAGSYPGCSVSRRLADNISDIKAQTSANQRGTTLLRKLCEEYSVSEVHRYMDGIQDNAETAVREVFKEIAKTHPEPLRATDYFDDGTPIVVTITINPETGSAVYDFTGTGPQVWGNYNCPISITHSAIIYTVRCLVNTEIPLNQGCLSPIEIRVPAGSILNPSPAVAICGSTLASQRVVDTILRAFGGHGASQGCASSFGWGMGGKDAEGKILPGWNYGESLGGGSGAGYGFHGADAVCVHSTNTRSTDPEVVEKLTAVLVRRNEIRHGSGGKGLWNGGNGLRREIEARIPLKFSILSDRRVYRPYGVNQGGPGEKGVNLAYKFNEDHVLEEVNLGGKAVTYLEPGEYIQINTPGGGAYGAAKVDRHNEPEPDEFHRAFV
ncbi:related to 5-oxoprolinase [Cephalotrichum gorgonifer]|uniref:Related to 5-oxoprolinase n=1 Tax=Cephalotrichum gorgonifer TaxID=2041049 RepID=A0AAE8N3V6_9PEZI|nr:related to 5-oxoprolinase [Cephalotrichum gorgonifer]